MESFIGVEKMILVSFELGVKVVQCQSPPEWAVEQWPDCVPVLSKLFMEESHDTRDQGPAPGLQTVSGAR